MATLLVGPTRPYTTIQSAINAANDNPATVGAMDEIVVDAGTYTESLSVTSLSGGWMVPCIIRAADPNNKPVIASTGAAQAVSGSIYRGSAAGQLTLQDLVFSGWTAASNAVIYILTEGLVLRRCDFVGCTNRAVIRNLGGTASRQALVDSCTFTGSGNSGSGSNGIIMMYSAYADVKNCKALCALNVQFQSGGGRYIEHNAVYGTWSTAVKVFAGVAAYRGNLIKNVGTGASHAIDATGGSYTENIAGGTFTTRFAGTDGGGNQNADPLFVNGAGFDLTLQSGSPASRSLARSANTLLDILGVSRSDPTDAGAYEMTLGTTVSSITVVDEDTIKLNFAALMTSDSTWTDAGNFAITATGSGAAVVVSAAAVTDAGMSITLTTSEHTDGEGYSVAWTGLTRIADDSDTYTGVGVDPTLSSVVPTGENTLRVTFSEPMATTNLETLAKYSVTPVVAGGPAVSVTAATRQSGSNPTYVDLTISDAVAGKGYTLSIASGLTDKALNPLGSTSGNFTSPSTTVASVARTATTVTLTFDRPVLVGASHTTAGNYSSTPSGGAVSVAVASAAASDPAIASSVVLTTSEHTQGGSYLLAWAGLAHLANGSSSYTGVGVAPTLGTVSVTGINTVRLPFSEAMATTGLETLARYTIAPVTAGGPAITVSAVARESGSNPTYVDLTFSETIAGKAYRISVASGLTDKALNPLGAATADFTAKATSLASIEVVSTTRIVATLTRRALYDPDLVSAANWQIKRLDPQFGMTPTIVSIAVDDDEFPQELTITTTNHTAGQAYEITYVGP